MSKYFKRNKHGRKKAVDYSKKGLDLATLTGRHKRPPK